MFSFKGFCLAAFAALSAVCSVIFPATGYAQNVISIVRLTPTTQFTNADAVTWRVTFDVPVQNVDAFDFFEDGDDDGGKYSSLELIALTPTTADFRLADNSLSSRRLRDYNGTMSLFVCPCATIQNLGGSPLTNFAVSGANESFTFDNLAPTLAITGPAGPVSAPFTATFTFSEDVTGFAVGDITVVNGAASSFQTVSASVYTATITPALGGAVTVDVAGGELTDIAGNTNTAAPQYSVSHDAVVPTLTIIGPAGPVNAAFTATFTFSEDVTGFAVGDILVANGTASNFQSVSATVYTVTITPLSNGPVTVNVGTNAAQDSGGSGNTAASPYSVTHDSVVPTLAITGPAGPVNTAFVATFTFSEDVTGFALGDITVGNGAASNLQSSSASVYTATVIPLADGAMTVNVAADVVQDLAGNNNPAASQYSVLHDATAPTLSITGPAGPVSGAFPATFTFSEDVTGFAVGDIIVANGAASSFQTVTSSVYTATITPVSNGSVTVNVPANTAEDAAGNGNTVASQYSVTNSQTVPSLTITGPSGPVSTAFVAIFTFSETVTGFALGDILVGNGSVSNFQSASASVYTATITPAADGPVTVDVAADAVQGSGGAGNTAATRYSVVHDVTAPTLIISGPAGPVSGDFTARMTASEAVTGLDISHIMVGNGTASNLRAEFAFPNDVAGTNSIPAATNFVVTITPAADGPVTIDIGGGAAQDAAGNGSTPATRFAVANDQTAPTATITGPAGPVAGAFVVTMTFSESVTGLELADLIVANGSASSLQSGSASVYTATITPASAGTVTLNLASASAVDAAGNGNTAATRYSVVNDAQASTIVITGPSGPVSGAFAATFTFSEAVSGFAVGDIIVGNATASNFQSASASVYTATITPAADGDVSIDVPGGVASDTAGNGNVAATRFSLTNDQTSPTLTIAGPAGPVTGAFTASLTFSEPVTGLVLSGIGISNGTASNLRAEFPADDGVSRAAAVPPARNFSVTVTPTADGPVTVSVAGGVAADAAGNVNGAAAPFTVTNNQIPPWVVSITRSSPAAALTNADNLIWAVRFSEIVTDIDTGDFDLSGTTGTITNVSPQTAGAMPTDRPAPAALSAYVFLVTAGRGDLASVNGDVVLSFSPDQNIVDLAGERLTNTTPSGANDNSYRLDNVAPTVALTTSASAPVAGPFTVSITFSEDVTGFDSSDLSVGGGSVSNFQVISATAYSALITPGSASAVAIVIPASSGHDAAGNGNLASAPLALGYAPDRLLTVILPGVGSGTVISTPAGIDCGSDCLQDYGVGTPVTLTATADAGSSFASWTTGPCTGSANTSCAFPLNADTIASARFTLESPPAGRIVAATLPGARSGHVGGPDITALLSVVSRTSSPAQSCQIAAPAGAPVGLTYRQLDGTGAPTGPESPLFDIVSGGTLNFVMALSPDRRTSAGGYEFMPVIACENASLDPIEGISSVLLNIGDAPAPDILSIAATPSGDGVIRIAVPGGVQFMTAAAVNIGIGDGSGAAGEVALTTTVDTGAAVLPLSLEICQIDAASICITPRSSRGITTTMSGSAPLFFAVFARDTSTGGIPFDPANARVFLRFADATGTIRSATSAAVTAPAQEAPSDIASGLPQGRWSVLMRQPNGVWPGLTRASLHVFADGRALIDDGITVRVTTVVAIAADADQEGRLARFLALGRDGVWTSNGAIRLGAPWADIQGEFWGVRDARSDAAANWNSLAGPFGDSLIVSETGEIRGAIDGCAVYGQATGLAAQAMTLNLSGCARSGAYLGVVDLPANDNDETTLLIANETRGWRVER